MVLKLIALDAHVIQTLLFGVGRGPGLSVCGSPVQSCEVELAARVIALGALTRVLLTRGGGIPAFPRSALLGFRHGVTCCPELPLPMSNSLAWSGSPHGFPGG